MRTGYNIYNAEVLASGRLAVDNICISKPAADVGIIEKLKNPGYPSADQNILMRCAVTNCVEETPAINRRVSVHYQYVARDTYSPDGVWFSADMAYMGKDDHGLDWYEGLIPTQRVGYVWYYYQVDYDGYHYGDNPLTGASESISPAYWDAGEDTHARPTAGTKFQVRPYRSRYSRIALEASPAAASVSEMTLVGDEQWQAVTLVNEIPVVSNYFRGYGYYEDDAEAYEAVPVTWGENNPDALSDPTLAGFLESSHDTTVTNRLVALNEKNYTGFYLYRFSSNDKDSAAAQSAEGDRRYDYIVKKAVYQDFDDWTASPDYYESSLGGLPTQTFTENFDGNAASAQGGAICVTNAWYEDTYATADNKDEAFENEELSDTFNMKSVTTLGGFIRTGSRILTDRKAKNTETRVNKTMALTLGGQFENTSGSLPHGLEKVTFKARASVDDSNFAVYKNGTAWNLPSNGNQIFVNATWQLSEMAPSKPYLSYIFLYQQANWEDGASWYEVRIIQNDSADANNNTVRVELWRKDSTASAPVFVAGAASSKKYYLNVSRPVNVRAYNESNKFCASVSLDGTTTYQATVKDSTANSAMLTKGGTIGFGVFDAIPNITAVKVGSSNGGTDKLASLTATYTDWYAGGRQNGKDRWTITSGAITRAVPTQTINIYAADYVGGEYSAIPTQISSTPFATVPVSSLEMNEFTVNFKAWNRKFVQLIYEAGDGGVVLDDVIYYPWRAVSRYNAAAAFLGNDDNNKITYNVWTSVDQQNEWLARGLETTGDSMYRHWAVLEGWTERSGAFQIGVNFERSRANTNLVQGIVSPELTNGLGSCSFSYAVSGGKVVYGVERTEEGHYNTWIPVAVYTNAAGDSGERYAKVGEYYSGRLRVRIYGEHDVDELVEYEDCGYDPAWGYTDPTAKILLDNLRVKDYPEDKNDNAWNAYNLRITGDAPDGQIYNNSGKSCFFNNDATNGVYGAEEFTEDDPYLESPPLRGVGVGEIAFQYRLVPGTAEAGADGHLVIKVAPDRDTPLAQWKTITNLVVSASGTAFVKFDNEKIFDENNFVVRFYNSKLPGTPRIVIDNVLITAPARPSFEFEYVRLLPVQPLSGSNTVVEAKIMREVMNPKNIEIYVSYHKYDTNNVNEAWGVTNWFNPRTSPKIKMNLVDGVDKVYRTPADGGIPAFDTDDIVEFLVWGVHDAINIDIGETPIRQGVETFELPEWYHTLDFDGDDEIVPMDMNVDKVAEGWSPYFWVFSCPPGTFFVNEINNWRTASVSYDKGTAEYIEFAGPAGTDIGGWTFRVVHNENISDETENFAYTVPSGTRLASVTETGWGFFTWGDSWASSDFRVDAAFPDSADNSRRNLYTTAGILVYRSNGMIEEAVSFGNDPSQQTAFNGEEYWQWAGRKKSNPAPISRISLTGAMPGATAADFVWWPEDVDKDDDYAEFYPAKTPGAPNTAQVFADIGGGAVVALCYPDGTPITDEAVLYWINSYNGTQEDIDALGTNAKVDEEFLLNLDLTKTCVAELKITSIHIEDGYVTLGVQLTRTEDGTPVGTREIYGTLKLLGRADLTAGTFTALQPDTFDSTFSTGNSVVIEYELPASNPPKFFKVIVE